MAMDDEPALDELLTLCGFERCVGFDSDEECDQCDDPSTVYFGDRSYWDGREGTYLCEACLRKRHKLDAEIEKELENWEELKAYDDHNPGEKLRSTKNG